jgi:chitodextrinase
MKTRTLLRGMLAAAALGVQCAGAVTPCAPMDFDGDCRSDILWRNASTGADVIYFMNGLSIVSAPTVDTVTDQAWQIQGIGDFDGDGKADILWRNALTGDDFIYLMNGATPIAQTYLDTVVGNAWQIQGIGDFDGDGKADILWRNTATGDNFIYLMNGTTIKSPIFLNTVSDQAWQVKGIGDFDGDGKADIFWRNSATGENYIYLMNGATIAARGTLNFVTDMAWQVKGVGDFDGDGKADILWRNSATGDVYVYLMNGLNSTTLNCCGYVTTIADQNWQVRAIGDFDGDGRADIFWRNSSTGDDFVFLMNGVAITAQAYVNTQADQYWMPKSSTTLADTTGPDKTPPTIPSGLSAGAVSSSRIDLSWRASTDNVGVTRYRVYRDGAQIATVSGTSYSNTGLQPLATYGYTVAASDAAGNLSAQSSAASATTRSLADTEVPSIPANLAAVVVSDSQIDLSWSASTDNIGVAGYRVYRDGALVASPAGILVSITGLAPSTLYSFTVSAFDAAGNASAQSAPLAAKTSPPVDTSPPTVPGGLAASAIATVSLTLSWNASTDNIGVAGYRVYRDGVLAVSSAAPLVQLTGLAPGTLYSFTVAAFDFAGNASAPSAALPVTMLPLPDTAAPSTPTGLAASALAPTSLTLSWNAATDNVAVAGYRVYRDGALAASSAASPVQLTGLAPNTLYSFTVSAFDAAGNTSVPSAALALATLPLPDTTTPSIPNGLAASALTASSLTLSWNAATDNVAVTGYRVYRNGVLVASPASPTAAISGLVANTQYAFTVSAFDAAGNASPQSAPLAVTTLSAPAPQILWSAGMEAGNLNEWSEKVNSGSADSWPVLAANEGIPPRGGQWVMKQSVTGSDGGSRMQRYPEINSLTAAGTTFYVSWWDYYPAKLTAAGSPNNFMFMPFGIASADNCTGCYNPIWGLFVNPADFSLVLGWSPNGMAPAEGPHAGESGKRGYSSTTPIPVGQWVYFEVMITPSSTFTGALKIWMNGQLLFDQANVKTRFPTVGIGGMMWTEHTAYGSYISPTPATHYVDDVTISLGRLPYAP